jgi:hypothetical protein
MREELLAGYPVVVRQAVVWGDMDSYRHVNNVSNLTQVLCYQGCLIRQCTDIYPFS